MIGCHPPTGSFLCMAQSNNLKKGGNELIPTHNVEKTSNPTHNKRAAISPAAKSPTQVTTGLGWAGLGWAGYPGSEWFKYPLSCYFRRLKSWTFGDCWQGREGRHGPGNEMTLLSQYCSWLKRSKVKSEYNFPQPLFTFFTVILSLLSSVYNTTIVFCLHFCSPGKCCIKNIGL